MEKKLLVKRIHGTEDRRTVFVSLTEVGHQAKEKIRSNLEGLRENLEEHITESDIAKLQEIVSKISTNHGALNQHESILTN